ncbi:MAG: penicillin-binding protein 2, partial [Pseudomonadales bacterium]|nr:penicillin-binding protein 2 [Pseudomonadales bacterium]
MAMFKRIALRDMVVEKRVFQQRMIASLIIFFCLAAGLALRYVNLQVFQHDRFVTESDRNRIHTLPLAPRRGLIYDRKGVLLAENQPSYSLAITEERVENLDEVLVDLQQLFDIDSRSVEKFRQRSQRRTPYQAVPLKFKLNDDEISRFAVNRYRLDGVEIKAQLVRHYPLGEEFSHVIGYVGRINQREQEKLFANKQQRINYAATDHIGKIGLEHHYEKVLHGSVGSQYVETNAHGRVLRVLQQVDPLPGTDLKLSVDATLQQQVHKL